MQSHDVIGSNTQKIAQLFPNCVTEHLGKDGKVEFGIDFEKLKAELSNEIIKALNDNKIFRSLCIQGGEPLAPQNLDGVMDLIYKTKLYSPFTRIYIWTGYVYEDLVQSAESDPTLKYILNTIDFLIDGPYIERLRDITLKMRGSSNQRIIDLTKK